MSLTTVDGSLISSGAITLTTQVTGTLPEANGGTGTTVGYCGFKNRIINGAMVIDQRNAGAEVNPAVSTTYYLDRWQAILTVAGKFKIGQNAGAVTPPAGYINYLGCTSLSAYTVGATENFAVRQQIEGLNVADLAFGTASAATVTLSFWVYSSLTGTFGGALKNSAGSRVYPFTYTISSANTWTQASVTVAGDTTGTWLTTNGAGLIVHFSLGSGATTSGPAGAWSATNYSSVTGAVSVVGTNAATWYVTGVQLEKGSTATSFDYRPYGTELALCQRYYEVIEYIYLMFPWGSGTQVIRSWVNYKVTKRAAATFTFGTKIEGAGTLGVTSGGPSGITITGGGSFQDVVGYSSATASAEL